MIGDVFFGCTRCGRVWRMDLASAPWFSKKREGFHFTPVMILPTTGGGATNSAQINVSIALQFTPHTCTSKPTMILATLKDAIEASWDLGGESAAVTLYMSHLGMVAR